MASSPEIHDHLTWLGYLQPDGLVVSPAALVDSGLLFDRNTRPLHQRFLEHLRDEQGWDETAEPILRDLPAFLTGFLGWPADALVPESDQPATLATVLPEYQETLRSTWAVRNLHADDPPFRLLVHELPAGQDFDAPISKHAHGWHASPARRFERLLRETRVATGLLTNGEAIRLLHAPPGENPGSLTFRLAEMTQIAGRPILGGFHLLLEDYRLFTAPENETLAALLKKSRDFQANVSTELSHQVLAALFELARGFQAADNRAKGQLLAEAWENDPQQIYGGLISTLLRMVFLLYAEDRGLMPQGELYLRNYSVQGLFDQLREDAVQYPDTMDERFGAWARLLAVFRATHAGCKHPDLTLPARQGHLFDPDRYPFLEGRAGSAEQGAQSQNPTNGEAADSHCSLITDHSALQPTPENFRDSLPLLSDGALHRILELLLYLDGERLSYRTLDVEQIGSVYETIMGFHVEKAPGRMIALKPKKRHGAPIHLSLDELLATDPGKRAKFLQDHADTKLTPKAAKPLKDAATHDDLLAALEKRIDRRATPHPVPAGSILLQPTDERRRSGSHYTPRSFTEPIVRKTLEPILDRLGRHPRPEAILDLKIADIAVGSAAFLVETCRQLADELVSSWHFHKALPVIPPDEDELLYARRLVAQRCLYGVDRNPMAVDLAKLSLWLATMARDHPFTFLDHAIKCGDSLVGLTNRQIAAFHWDPAQAAQRVMGQEQMEKLIHTVTARRKEIIADPEDTEYAILRKQARLAEADAAAQKIKTTGDLAIAAFFAGSKPRERQQLRDDFLEKHLALQRGQNVQENLPWQTRTLHQLRSGEHPIRPFHWEIEFPEVFSRENPGFDGIVGNPPYAGKNTMLGGNREGYLDWLKSLHAESHGNADLVAHFFRRAFTVLRQDGTFGLIATNTIRQGDTRQSGLRWICTSGGGTIFAAHRRYKWVGTAAVTVSVVWVVNGRLPAPFDLDGKDVPVITAYLFHDGGHGNPAVLAANANHSFVGSYVLGMGFTFDDTDKKGIANSLAEMERLVEKDPRNGERIFPYIGGEEVNDSPIHAHHRYVINFSNFPRCRAPLEGKKWKNANERQRDAWLRTGNVPEDYPGPVAFDWPDLLEIVERKVKPERLKQSREIRARYWWRFGETTPALFAAIHGMERVLVISLVTQYLSFSFQPANMVFSKNLAVFPLLHFYHFCLLQSSVHDTWARFFSSTLEDRLNYSPSDCFETFPFPSDWEENAALEEAGKTYYEYRAELMVRNDEGLTKTYNRFHDPDERSPDILRLRELHAAMDRAVLDAYGWTDIPTDCQFLLDYEEDEDEEPTAKKRRKKKPWRYRWPDEVRDEVLARLLALNATRHAEEVRQGIAPGMKKAKKAAAKKTTKKSVGKLQQTIIQRDKAEDELI